MSSAAAFRRAIWASPLGLSPLAKLGKEVLRVREAIAKTSKLVCHYQSEVVKLGKLSDEKTEELKALEQRQCRLGAQVSGMAQTNSALATILGASCRPIRTRPAISTLRSSLGRQSNL